MNFIGNRVLPTPTPLRQPFDSAQDDMAQDRLCQEGNYDVGLYIHIPFCVRKCLYCDFVSYPQEESDVQNYFEALQAELNWYKEHNFFSEYYPQTLYVGGGTPSLVIEELITFLQANRACFQLDSPCEVTIEVNPGTIALSQFEKLLQAGFNRASLGVQSFHNEALRTLGRIHTAEEASACFQGAKRAGFRTIGIDLIFGIPGSTVKMWQATLKQAIALQPEHISTYNLTIEKGTPFWNQEQQGLLKLPDEELQLEMYDTGIEMLTQAGYEHYEISNFALPGYRCHHNQIYWRNEEYLGLGAAAHSYLKGWRYWNYSKLEKYIASCKNVTARPGFEGEEHLDMIGTMGETVMMNLRMLDGIDMTDFYHRFGQSLDVVFAKPIEKLRSLGLLELSGNHLRLTRKGIYLSDEVFQEFVTSKEQGTRSREQGAGNKEQGTNKKEQRICDQIGFSQK